MTKFLKHFFDLYSLRKEEFSNEELIKIENFLSRSEEIGQSTHDFNWEWPLQKNNDDYKYPKVDQLINSKKTNIKSSSIWPNKKSFALCLTHDVDYIHVFPWKERLKAALLSEDASTKNRAKYLVSAFKNFVLSRFTRKNERTFPFDKFLDIEKKFGFKSSFFFVVDPKVRKKNHINDCFYSYSDGVNFYGKTIKVSQLLKEINSMGWDIGLHASIYSQNNSQLKKEKKFIEKNVMKKIISNRFHYLSYDAELSPKFLFDADFKIDSSLGSNVDLGYRCGTGLPYIIYSASNKSLYTLPLVIQDNQLFKKFGLDTTKTLEYITQVFEKTSLHGTCITLLWHPNYNENSKEFNLYYRILEIAKEFNAWGCSASEVVDHIENK